MYRTRPPTAVTTKATVISVATTSWVVILLMNLAMTAVTVPFFATTAIAVAGPRPSERPS